MQRFDSSRRVGGDRLKFLEEVLGAGEKREEEAREEEARKESARIQALIEKHGQKNMKEDFETAFRLVDIREEHYGGLRSPKSAFRERARAAMIKAIMGHPANCARFQHHEERVAFQGLLALALNPIFCTEEDLIRALDPQNADMTLTDITTQLMQIGSFKEDRKDTPVVGFVHELRRGQKEALAKTALESEQILGIVPDEGGHPLALNLSLLNIGREEVRSIQAALDRILSPVSLRPTWAQVFQIVMGHPLCADCHPEFGAKETKDIIRGVWEQRPVSRMSTNLDSVFSTIREQQKKGCV